MSKIKKCWKCKVEINKFDKICPNCKKRQYLLRKKIIAFFLILFLMIIVIALFTNNNSILINKKFYSIIEEDVKNGIQTKTIGKTAYIEINKEQFKQISSEEYSNLVDYINQKKYNWFIVVFEDKTGLYCIDNFCFYSNIEKDNNINKYTPREKFGIIVKNDNANDYYYKPYDE